MSIERKTDVVFYNSEVQGIEYDWIAVDQEGAIASFSTGGEGFVPVDFIQSISRHDGAIDKMLSLPVIREPAAHPSVPIGVRNVWKDLAERGCYAYDFDLKSRSYRLIGRPAVALAVEEFSSDPVFLGGFLRVPLIFGASDSIALDDFGGTNESPGTGLAK